MAKTLIYKILQNHLVDGSLEAGQPIGIRIDQTLTQDATGTTAFLLFESMGTRPFRTDLSVSYIDYNMSQIGPENHNDHLCLEAVAGKSGAFY
jgi:aconitate hydratase